MVFGSIFCSATTGTATMPQPTIYFTQPQGLAAALIWGQWVTTATASSITTTDVWNTWLNNGTIGLANAYPQQQASLSQQAAMMEQHRRVADAAAQERRAADTKAKAFMRDNLTPIQREALEKHGWFLVEGGKSRKLYRVYGDRGCAGNIYELDAKEKEIARYCVHARADIPLGDQLLAQALSLRFDEDHIIATANRTPVAA
jgi:hypothetical protein